ncbi:hypothetical protein [Pseudaquidulcibacter saccharophilus]|uniref:hypothetical protein n=1 Tax=Pseudaquidulcibacter saccharophilus TaxID=2831900 RepID=UPI001EFEFC49|nr:hypothetical protein [Pseudaquidulcibacter saccharophilus]
MNNYDYCVLWGLIKSIERMGALETARIYQNELEQHQSGFMPRPISLFRIELYSIRHEMLNSHETRLAS